MVEAGSRGHLVFDVVTQMALHTTLKPNTTLRSLHASSLYLCFFLSSAMSYYPQQPSRQSSRPHRKVTQKPGPYPPQGPPAVGLPHGAPPPVHIQQAQTQQIDKRFVRRPVERNIPPKVEALIPEAKLYKDLQEVEQRMDATISRKRLDVEDMLAKGTKVSIYFYFFMNCRLIILFRSVGNYS